VKWIEIHKISSGCLVVGSFCSSMKKRAKIVESGGEELFF
jgi:hypothetical protein